MKIKVCGIREKENMEAVAALQPDMMGFIFFPASPRYMWGKLTPSDLSGLPDSVMRVGVFVNETTEKMLDIASAHGLNAIQLHGVESPDTCLALRGAGYTVIKAFGVSPGIQWATVAGYESSSSCDYFLFDTASSSHGGTGFLFDWTILEGYTGDTPFLLSGGIGPGMEEKVLSFQHPRMAGIDVNSRFETSPGVKDIVLLSTFISRLREAQPNLTNSK